MPSDRPLSIFVVDDDELSRALLEMLLMREGYRVETAESGEAALASLRARGRSAPDAILTDIQMPGISGAQLAKELRAVCGDRTRILAISGSVVQNELLAGFDGFLQKPFDMAELAAMLAGKNPAAEPNEPEKAVLDERVYEKLKASMGREKLASLYALCLEDTRKRIEQMRSAAEQGNAAEWRRQAHTIKGSGGMLGASELQAFAALLETGGIELVSEIDKLFALSQRLEVILVQRNLLPSASSPR
jgi:CheY-like chemotaxis protein